MSLSLVSCNSATNSTTSPIDLSPPQAPTNLHSSTDASIQRDWLIWDPSASAGVAGYEIYVSASAGTNGTLFATVDASSDSYLLPITSTGGTEFYRVRAVGSNNVPSAFTSSLSVDRTTWDGSQPPTGPTKGHDGDF